MAAKRKKRNPGNRKDARKPSGDTKKPTAKTSAPPLKPVPPVGEGDDNLPRREDWFRRRTGAS